MTRRRLLAATAATAAARALPLGLPRALLPGLPLTGVAAHAQSRFPSRPVTLIVPFAPGGVADMTARIAGAAMAASLGQPLLIENRPGAGGVVATQAFLQAPADGHTLMLISNATAVSVHLVRKLPYDVTKIFAPVSTLGAFDLGIAVRGDSPHRTLGELTAFARANPGRLTLGAIAPGSTQHLSAELFKARAGIDAVVVSYKGSPALITALRAGEIDAAFEILSPMLPQLSAGAIRLLAVTGERRAPQFPQVPTVQQQGIGGYVATSWNALAAPAGTPAENIERLRLAVRQALSQPEVRERLVQLGVTPQPGSPAQASALLASEIGRWGEVVRAAKIAPE